MPHHKVCIQNGLHEPSYHRIKSRGDPHLPVLTPHDLVDGHLGNILSYLAVTELFLFKFLVENYSETVVKKLRS